MTLFSTVFMTSRFLFNFFMRRLGTFSFFRIPLWLVKSYPGLVMWRSLMAENWFKIIEPFPNFVLVINSSCSLTKCFKERISCSCLWQISTFILSDLLRYSSKFFSICLINPWHSSWSFCSWSFIEWFWFYILSSESCFLFCSRFPSYLATRFWHMLNLVIYSFRESISAFWVLPAFSLSFNCLDMNSSSSFVSFCFLIVFFSLLFDLFS